MLRQSWLIKVSLASLLLSGCATKPTTGVLHEGRWQARVNVTQLKKNHTIPLNVEVRGRRLEYLRLDVNGPLGNYVGSVAMRANVLQALVVRDKEFYQGPARAEALKKVFHVALDPRWINRLLFENPDKAWRCERDQSGLLTSCLQPDLGLKAEWGDRDGERKVVTLQTADYRVEMALRKFQPKVESGEEIFTLKQPEGFSLRQL